MTTFVLKKYEEPQDSPNGQIQEKTEAESKPTKDQITIEIKGSIAEIVADALYKLMPQINDEEQPQPNGEPVNVTALSTEDINTDPVSAFSQVGKDDVVFIQNNGFHTQKEEWFLLNLPNKTNNVFFSVESLIKHFQAKLKAS